MSGYDGTVKLAMDFDASLGTGGYKWRVTLKVGRAEFRNRDEQWSKQQAIEQVLRDNASLIAHEINLDHNTVWAEMLERERATSRAYAQKLEQEDAEACQI